jgi:3-oxoacyl-(acyl-carrier-protein) synthase
VTGLPAAAPDLDRHVLALGLGAPDPVVLARAEWPDVPEDALTPIPGFVVSSFSPLVAEVAERCLRSRYGAPPAEAELAARTGIVLASVRGDVTTADAIGAAVREGRRVQPLLFFQSNPNAVLGHVAARWGLAGPVVCTSPTGEALPDALAVAALLIEGGDAAEVLVIAADLAESGIPELALPDLGVTAEVVAAEGTVGHAVAVLVGPRVELTVTTTPPVAALKGRP